MTSKTATTLPTTLDTTPCSRCGGTGTFIAHPMQQTGTVCFRCGGSRTERLSKKMAKIQDSLPALIAAKVHEQTYIGVNLYTVLSVAWLAPDSTILVRSPFGGKFPTQVNVVKTLRRETDGKECRFSFLASERISLPVAEYNAMDWETKQARFPRVTFESIGKEFVTGSSPADTTGLATMELDALDYDRFQIRNVK